MGKSGPNSSLLGVVISVIVLLIFITSGTAESKEPLIFLANEKLAPLIYVDNGVVKGVVADLAYALGEKMGREVKIIPMDWEEAQNKLLSGEADALLQINRNQDRESKFDFSEEFLRSEFAIFRHDDDTFVNRLVDLEGKRVGTEAKGFPYYMLKDLDNIDVVAVSNWTVGFQMVASGDLDALIVERWIGEYELAKSSIRGIHTVQEPIDTGFSHIAVQKGNNYLLGMLNAGLKEMKEDGTMSRILDKWQGKSVIYITREYVVRIALLAVIAILVVASSVAFVVVHKLRNLNHELELNVVDRTRKLQEANEQLRQANEELAKITMVDGLTQVYNRRGFDSLYKRAWAMSMREAQPLTVIMMDIDEFKSYNDQYGHLAGDQCVRNVANALEVVIRRPGDVVARFGGDEFVVVLFNTSEDGGVIVADNIREEIAKLKIDCRDLKLSITVSLGVASVVPSKESDPAFLIELADQALYRAKEDGRNQVVRASLL